MYSIGYVSRRTGLSSHVIRAWERRYQAVQPLRSGKNRRLYSEAEVQRLLLLKHASESHHSIGQVAQLPTEALLDLSSTDDKVVVQLAKEAAASGEAQVRYLDQCTEAIRNMDDAALKKLFTSASVNVGIPALLSEIVSPLMQRIGELWAHGQIRVVEEHLASVVVRTLLGNLNRQTQSALSPRMVVTTPAGQMHEFGALAVSIQAASFGWNVQYLGGNLPAEEIALAVQRKGARVVALSLLYKGDEATLFQELQRLRAMVGSDVHILAGGPAASAYRQMLHQVSAIVISDFNHLKKELDRLQ